MQTLQRVGGQLRFVPSKTEDPSRTVPLPGFCLNAVKERAERWAGEHYGAADKRTPATSGELAGAALVLRRRDA